MAKAEATVDELVSRIERGQLCLPEMQRRHGWRSRNGTYTRIGLRLYFLLATAGLLCCLGCWQNQTRDKLLVLSDAESRSNAINADIQAACDKCRALLFAENNAIKEPAAGEYREQLARLSTKQKDREKLRLLVSTDSLIAKAAESLRLGREVRNLADVTKRTAATDRKNKIDAAIDVDIEEAAKADAHHKATAESDAAVVSALREAIGAHSVLSNASGDAVVAITRHVKGAGDAHVRFRRMLEQLRTSMAALSVAAAKGDVQERITAVAEAAKAIAAMDGTREEVNDEARRLRLSN